MKDWTKLLGLLLSLAVVMAACSSDGGGDGDSDDRKVREKEESKPSDGGGDKAAVKAARDAWPAYTGSFKETIDLSAYNVVTIVPFANLTDNSRDKDAGQEFAEEVEDTLTGRYSGTFATVRVAEAPLGQADEVVLRGQVYDYSKGGYSYWTGRSKNKFKTEFVLENGQSGQVLKSSQIKEDSHSDGRSELREEAAEDVAKMIARSKE